MFHSIKKLEGYKIQATDGEVGKVYDFYFDDKEWVIRYLIADTGGWLTGRRVLISPESLGKPNYEEEIFPINLTKKQIENSPPIEEDKPVTRQFEQDLIVYYNWPAYWVGGAGGQIPTPIPPVAAEAQSQQEKELRDQEKEEMDPNLKSERDILGYDIHASDGSIGHIEDFIVDDANWKIRYAIIDTKNWLPGKKVIVALDWIEKIDWVERAVVVSHTKEEIKNSPEYDPDEGVQREFEEKLYSHYSRDRYWL
jgi:sporulation protein YlmC with PRC-barrel domain